MVMVANQPPYWIASRRAAAITPVPPKSASGDLKNSFSFSFSFEFQVAKLEAKPLILAVTFRVSLKLNLETETSLTLRELEAPSASLRASAHGASGPASEQIIVC
ncbi:MAG: hypothetical protein ACHP7I_06995 [Terriglobales bacterium]